MNAALLADSMLTLQEAAVATHGSATHGDRQFAGVSADTRSIAAGDLFVALKGENFDGHEYVRQALAKGAAAAMVESAWAEAHPDDLPLVVVKDSRRALGELAANWRSRFVLPLIGITGSNGKTTVKEMCASIFRQQAQSSGAAAGPAALRDSVLATAGNLNNDIGLPLTLLKMRAGHVAAVIEMGMNHVGEIAYLTNIARPTVAVITNAQRAHLEGLGGVAAVAREKGSIFAGLPADGTAVINADDPHAGLWRDLNPSRRILTFGLSRPADVTARYILQPFGSLLQLTMPGGESGHEVRLGLPGMHNVMNALAAAAAALAAGVPVAAIAAGLSAAGGVKGRLQRLKARNGATLIDDSYNANPDSVRVAIDVLAAMQGKKILVFGDMGEVGEQAGQFHDEIGGYAKSMGVDRMLALGDLSAAAVRNFDGGAEHFKSVAALLDALVPLLDANTTVLVKGSRFMKMERVVEAVVEP